MAVPVSKRTLSDMEFYHNAVLMRLKITNLLLRDFAVKDGVRKLSVLNGMKGMTPEDIKTLEEIAKKYHCEKPVLLQYPQWLIETFRTNVLGFLRDIIHNIRAANSIYVLIESEYVERRILQTRAIYACEQLLEEFQFIIHVLPCDINCYLPYAEDIQKEIALLKGWRKSDNRILKQIREGKRKIVSEKKDKNKKG